MFNLASKLATARTLGIAFNITFDTLHAYTFPSFSKFFHFYNIAKRVIKTSLQGSDTHFILVSSD